MRGTLIKYIFSPGGHWLPLLEDARVLTISSHAASLCLTMITTIATNVSHLVA